MPLKINTTDAPKCLPEVHIGVGDNVFLRWPGKDRSKTPAGRWAKVKKIHALGELTIIAGAGNYAFDQWGGPSAYAPINAGIPLKDLPSIVQVNGCPIKQPETLMERRIRESVVVGPAPSSTVSPKRLKQAELSTTPTGPKGGRIAYDLVRPGKAPKTRVIKVRVPVPAPDYRVMTPTQILIQCFSHLAQVKQWSTSKERNWVNSMLEYTTKAECLIELLEGHTCGSWGGYDKGQTDQSLFGRFEWLVLKAGVSPQVVNTESKHVSYQELKNWFIERS